MGEWLFGSPWMLGWLAAAAAPWVIYFLHRPRRRQLAWGAMLFLQRVLAKERVRRRSEWLLLALRTLAVAAIALAFADPRWSAGESAGGRLRVFVLDDSFSLAAVRERRSVWEEATAIVRRNLDAAAPGDRWQLILAADPPRKWFAEPTSDPQAVRAAIDSLQPGQGRADAVALTAFVSATIEAEEQQPEVLWLTDGQRTSWETALAKESFAALRSKADHRVPALSPVTTNVAVVALQCQERLPTTGQSVKLTARVKNFGPEPRPATAVSLWINGDRAAEQRIDLAAEAAADLQWEHRFAAAGVYRVVVEVADPALETDNRRHALVDVRDAVRVLALEGTPDEARPFALALEPNPGPAARIKVERVPADQWGDRKFADYEMILLADVAEMSPALVTQLREYVQAGGGLVIAPGESLRMENLAAELLPATIEPPGDVALTTFDPRDYRDPLVDLFRGRERSGLLTTPTWRHFRLKPMEDSVIALGFTDGEPAVIYRDFGRGRVYLWAIPFSGRSRTMLPDGSPTPWTAFDAWPSFPPLMQRQLQEAARAGRQAPELFVGRSYESKSAGRGPFSIVRPDGGRVELAETRARFDATNAAGVYEVVSDQTTVARFVVNVDPAESDLARVDVDRLREALGDSSATTFFAAAAQHRLFRPAFALAAILLVAESWLARRLGRMSR